MTKSKGLKEPKEKREETVELPSKETKEEGIKHIIRIANTDLEGKKSVLYALTGIRGIGRRMAKAIALKVGVNPHAIMGQLSVNEVNNIKAVIDDIENQFPEWMMNRQNDFYTGESKHMIGADLILSLREDLNRMKKIRCYKGIRHEMGQKVRGQRTRSTGRTGSIVGVTRKKVAEAEKKKAEEKKAKEKKEKEA
jgi:small subunit ribosomal protein S13